MLERQSDHLDPGKATHGFRWTVLALFLLLQTGAALPVLSFGPLAPFLQDDLNISRVQVGLFTSIVYAGVVFFGGLCGWLIDRFGVRRFLWLAPGIIAVFFVALANTHSYMIALVLVFGAGLGYVFINPSAAKALTGWFSPQTRATAMGVMKSGVNLGGALGAAILPSLAVAFGWRTALVGVAVLVVILGVFIMLAYREAPAYAAVETGWVSLRGIGRVLTNGSILLLGVTGIVYSATQLSISTYLVLFLKESALFSVIAAGTYLTVVSLSGALGRVLWGIISDRLFGGRRKAALSIMGLTSAAMAISIAFWASAVPPWTLYIMMAILGFSSFGWTAVYIALLAELVVKEQAATAVGFGLAYSGLGILFGPPLFGYIVDVTQSYTTGWIGFGVAAAMGAIIVLLIQERPHHA